MIRQAIEKDMQGILACFEYSIRGSCNNDYSPQQINVWVSGSSNSTRWKKALGEQFFLVAEEDGMIAAFGSLTDSGWIDFLFVHPDWQGVRLAKQILSLLISEARNREQKLIQTYASITAKPFFKSQGFLAVQENQVDINGVFLTNYTMQKILN